MKPELRRILLVEDDPDIALLSEIALQEVGGFETHLCGSGAEALEQIDGFAPDLALLDFRLPGMNGAQLMDALRSRPEWADLPIIFLTASVMHEHIDDLRRRGAAGIISKPFDPITLPEQVSAIWQSLCQESPPATLGSSD